MAAAVFPIREVRRRRASLASREAQSLLTPSPVADTYASPSATHVQADANALLAAWEADAIEPDVASSRGSFYTSVQSSTTSTDGESSPCSSRRRFRSLRVSIRRHRRRRKSFQYHVPVHLLAHSSLASATRRRQSSVHNHIVQEDDVMLASFSSSTTAATSHRGSLASSSSQGHGHGHRHRHSHSHAEGWRPWSGPAKHAVLESLSDADEPSERTEPRREAASEPPASSSRRHRAWSKLKAHAPRLPRLSRSHGNTKSKASGLFSISFYPWKMEAHGYYSTPEAAVEWVPDTASARCQICVASFNLARRRHHCRLCGRLVCNECSLQRTFLPIAERSSAGQPVASNPHSLIKSGEPQRTCDSCAHTLKRMVAQHDHRVKEISVDPSAISCSAQESGSAKSTGRPSYAGRASDLMSTHHHLQLARPRGLSRTSLARNDELDQVLRARAKSRAAGVVTLQHVVSSLWLEQWLQFVEMDSGDAVSHGTQRHSQLGRPSMTSSSRGSMSSSRHRRSTRFAFGRRPGPIANYELLDYVNGKLVPRADLRRSRGTDRPGDFHVISHDVWLVFRRLYGGGPCITIDDDVPSRAHTITTATGSRLILHGDPDATPFDGDFGKPPPPPQWNITELDDTDTTNNNAPSVSPFVAPNATPPATELAKRSVVKQRPVRGQPCTDQRHVALRSTTTCEFDTSKHAPTASSSSSRRPASATTISMPAAVGPPPMLSRSTSESRPPTAEDPQGRRKSLTFIGYLKKWRQGDETPSSSRPSGASTTISQVDDDGVVLYDPAKLVIQHRASEDSDLDGYNDGVDFSRSRGPEQQRETIAAVSAFAAAAAEARRKSAMSLMRHSTTALTRPTKASRTTTRAASPPGVMTA